MPTFRKKPVEVEAVRWHEHGDDPDVEPLGTISFGDASDAQRQAAKGGCEECSLPIDEHGWIGTREGGHRVCPGDWIITGVEGERYPCKPSIFEKTYEEAETHSGEEPPARVYMLDEAKMLAKSQHPLPISENAVRLALWDLKDPSNYHINGVASVRGMSLEAIGQLTNLSGSEVCRCIDRLAEKGYVRVTNEEELRGAPPVGPDAEPSPKLTTGKDLAERLDVARSTLSEATKEGYNCAGHPVSDWARRSGNGRVVDYDLPDDFEDAPPVGPPVEEDVEATHERPHEGTGSAQVKRTALESLRKMLSVLNERRERDFRAEEIGGEVVLTREKRCSHCSEVMGRERICTFTPGARHFLLYDTTVFMHNAVACLLADADEEPQLMRG